MLRNTRAMHSAADISEDGTSPCGTAAPNPVHAAAHRNIHFSELGPAWYHIWFPD
jgi:hypothetical protein